MSERSSRGCAGCGGNYAGEEQCGAQLAPIDELDADECAMVGALLAREYYQDLGGEG